MEIIDAFTNEFTSVLFIFTLLFIMFDVVTGYAQAIANKNIQSEKMRKGFWHKLAIILALVLAGAIDVLMGTGVVLDTGISAPIFEAACVYVIVMELSSILENIKKMNPELAGSKLLDLFGSQPEGKHGEHEKTEDGSEDGKEVVEDAEPR